MPAVKSSRYHAVLDLLDRGQTDVAADRMQEWKQHLTVQEFKLLLNAFIRRNQTVRTA